MCSLKPFFNLGENEYFKFWRERQKLLLEKVLEVYAHDSSEENQYEDSYGEEF